MQDQHTTRQTLFRFCTLTLLVFLVTLTASAQTIIFEETFDEFKGSGPIEGEADSWSGLTLNAVESSDLPTGWKMSGNTSDGNSSVRKANYCVCVGSSSKSSSSNYSDLAYLQTAPIKEVGTYILSFRAAAWNLDIEQTTLKLGTNSDGNLSYDSPSFTLEKAKFNIYSTKVIVLRENSPIRFKNVNRAYSRFFLDDIKLVKMDESSSGEEAGGTTGGESGSETGSETGGSTGGDTPSAESGILFKRSTSFEVGKEYLIASKDDAGVYYIMDPQNTNKNKCLNRVKIGKASNDKLNFPKEEAYKPYLIIFENTQSPYRLHSVSVSKDIKLYNDKDASKYFKMTSCSDAKSTAVWTLGDKVFGEDGSFLVKCGGRYLEMSSGNKDDDFRTYATVTYACPIYLYEKVEKSPVGTISIVAPEGYGTYYTDKSFIMPEGVDGAIVSDISDDGKLQINWKYPAGTTVPANTGLLVYASQKGSYQCYEAGTSDNGGSNGSNDLSGNAANGIGQTNNEVAGSAAKETNYLRGTIEKIQVPEDASSYRFYQLTYGLVENVRTIGFFYASEDGGTFINGANKAYLAIPRSMSSVSSLYSLSHNLGTTGIDQSLTENIHDHAPCTIYSITGQRLIATDSRQLPKGVYIINGKKIMVK